MCTFRPNPVMWQEFKTDLGQSVGQLMELIPLEAIFKVMLEEVCMILGVLIGDSCHKVLSNAGRGALNAMMETVTLTNDLYEMRDDVSPKQIEKLFKEYFDERHPHAREELAGGSRMVKVFAGQIPARGNILPLPSKISKRYDAEQQKGGTTAI
ncbi:hypothetical protein BGZ83_010501 [Gryganskiella cystojenkinii]|nr:hypothetical protein BGZ83_010501 [Gryganskiella cystojenkinii]